jgi:hypothetical protein
MRMGAATRVKLCSTGLTTYISRSNNDDLSQVFGCSSAGQDTMATLCFLLCAISILQVGRACDFHAEEDLLSQHTGDFLVKNYDMIPEVWNAHHYHPIRPPSFRLLYNIFFLIKLILSLI